MEAREMTGIALFALLSLLLVAYAIWAVRSGYVHFGARPRRIYRHEDPGTFWTTIVFGGIVVPVLAIGGMIWELSR